MESEPEFSHQLGAKKEVKFMIPIRQHVSLHSLKLLTNRTISDAVAEALEQYFRRHEVDVERSTHDF